VAVKKHPIRILVVSVAVVVATVAAVLSRRAAPLPKVTGSFSPQDVREIEQAVRHGRWEVSRDLLARRKFAKFAGVCLPDIALGRVREISPCKDQFMIVPGGSITSASGAFALSRAGFAREPVSYTLARTTIGWKVISINFPK
jgi:hypothetical protein